MGTPVLFLYLFFHIRHCEVRDGKQEGRLILEEAIENYNGSNKQKCLE
jgi:hypothetical protein